MLHRNYTLRSIFADHGETTGRHMSDIMDEFRPFYEEPRGVRYVADLFLAEYVLPMGNVHPSDINLPPVL